MFMNIVVNDSTQIVINLGQDVSKANDLVKMFESNAKFVNLGYQELKVIEPKINIELGDELTIKGRYGAEETVTVKASPDAPVGFVVADNQAFIDIKGLKDFHTKALEKKQLEIKQLQAQLDVANHRIEVLTETVDQVML